MKTKLSQYFQIQEGQVLLLDRAFLGLYALFKVLAKKSHKRKVVFPSTTCPSPVFAAIYAGLTPVFADVSLDNYLMDKEDLADLLDDEEILSIVYIYMYGHISSDILKIQKRSQEKGIYLIEDLAQAFGVEREGMKGGLIGDFSVLSFGYSKQIDAGSGGALLLNSSDVSQHEIEDILKNCERYTPDPELAMAYSQNFYTDRKRALINDDYTIYQKYVEQYRPLYFKEISVDWSHVKKVYATFLEQEQQSSRNLKAKKYERFFKDELFDFHLPEIEEGSSVYRYTFLTQSAAEAVLLSDCLREQGINCSNLYLPVSRFFNESGFKNATLLAKCVINLWVDHTVDDVYMEKTFQVIKEFKKKYHASH